MGKVEDGLKIYPKGVFELSEIGRELKEEDLVGVGLTSDDLYEYYLKLTFENSLVSDAKLDIISYSEELMNEEFGTYLEILCLIKLKGSEKHVMFWRSLNIIFTDEYGAYSAVDEVDGEIYYINPEKYLEVSKKNAERERVEDEKRAIKFKEDTERYAIEKEKRELAKKERYEKEKREMEESYNRLTTDKKELVKVLRVCDRGLLKSKEYKQLMLAISKKVRYVEDIQLLEENTTWLTIKVVHPKGFNKNKTRTSSILKVHKTTFKVFIYKGLWQNIYVSESYRSILNYIGDQNKELLTYADCKERYNEERMVHLTKLMDSLK